MSTPAEASEAPPKPFDRLLFLRENLMREQDFFWQRFYAFAALHAGAFVVATSTAFQEQQRPLAAFGLMLASFWVFTQWASLHYVDRWKPPYYLLLKQFEIIADDRGWFARSVGRFTAFSSTNAALATAWLVLGAWLWLGGWVSVSWRLMPLQTALPAKAVLTFSYLLVVAGSLGMVLFTTRFPFTTILSEQQCAEQRLCGLNGQQVWRYSWGAIILGTMGQLLALWFQ